VPGTRKAAGSAGLVLVDGAVPLRPEPALFDAMLEGWRRQKAARRHGAVADRAGRADLAPADRRPVRRLAGRGRAAG